MSEPKVHVVHPFKSFTAGGVGGACVVLIGHPFDTIKVRLQTMPRPTPQKPPLYTGAIDCAAKSIRSHGLLNLYKGMGAPIISVAPIFACSFFGYNLGKNLCAKNTSDIKPHELVFAGMFSGIFTTVITAPVERVKCLLQVQLSHLKVYDGPIDVIRSLYRSGGLRSVYRGSVATLLRDVPGCAVFFPIYESLRKYLSIDDHISIPRTILAGGTAGLLSWMVSLPPDVLKSRYQSAPEGHYEHGLRSVLVNILRHEGPTALFRGASVVMLRAFPANAACFVGYELTMQALDLLLPNW